ncbi:MAG: ABC transporter permease [Acidobacteria bacterium]|nr:ABC transporter permease [Acidobacteriota bacterium]
MRLRTLIHNLFSRRQIDSELDAELRAYVDMLAEEKIASGMPPPQARREARVESGGLEQVKEQVRVVRSGALIEQFVQDLTYGVRVLRRNPSFTLVAVCTLAIGLGATTAIFSVVNSVLLRPLPYAAPDSLFRVENMHYTGEFVELQRRGQSFEVAAYVTREATITGGAEPQRVAAASVSPNLMPLLGVTAQRGRALEDGDERASNGAVVVISHEFWRSRFGGDPGVLGRLVTLDGTSRTVVGVMPRDFDFPTPATQLWTPAVVDPNNRIALWSSSRQIIGRLRPGATLSQADAEVRAIAPLMRSLFPWGMPADYGQNASLIPLKQALVADVRPLLTLLLAAVGMVLLIACVNVSNLLVARTLARQRELAIRASLGAARGRIVRQVLTEGALLVLCGIVLGVPIAYFGMQVLVTSLPTDMPRSVTLALDRRLFAFAATAFAACALIVGVFPASRAAQVDLVPRMAEGERTGQSRRTRWTSNLLVGTQMALAVMLVVSAVLLARTLANLHAVSTGFAVEQVVSARISPPQFRFPNASARRDLYSQVLERAAGAPGVVSAAVTDRLPLGGEAYGSVFSIEGRPDPARTGEWPIADVSAIVSPAFFSTLGMPVQAGRTFTPDDSETSQRVAVISESLANKYWPGESPIGRRFGFPGDGDRLRTIVGVVADVKWERVTDQARTALYVPITQAAPGAMRVLVRTTGDPSGAQEHIRSIVRGIDRDTPVDRPRTMADLVATAVEGPRFAALLVTAFAVAGLLLGGIGIYGTVSDHVAQRRREFGVRVALGAQRSHVFRAMLGGTMAVVAAGTVAGLVGAAVITRLFATMLFDIAPTDPATFALAVGILAATAVLAGYLPARRASRVDPLSALRVG